MSANFEKYLAGEPVNEELAQLRRGQLALGDKSAWNTSLQDDVNPHLAADAERALSAEDRSALRELRQGPGWPVLQSLLNRAIISHTNSATVLSQHDPLTDKNEIAQAWHTVKVWKLLQATMNLLVESELSRDRQKQEANLYGGENAGP